MSGLNPDELAAMLRAEDYRTCRMCRSPVYVPTMPPGYRLELSRDPDGKVWAIPHTPQCPLKETRWQ